MITVKPFNVISNDERGETKSFKVKDYGEFIYITRKKGSLCGNTYHKGQNEGTRLKTFVLLQGEVTVHYRHINSEKSESLKVIAPSVIEIEPLIVHNMHVENDIVILENNSINDIQEDVIRETV
ncbi:polysaccharide biosynthesis C-terminal domain-containing protein [Vibrio hepatarius]|uniref:polysaccharide biosynthesis C-terminal domain-containing protein n=1 Tax=Vibrio hepatarius TaxID=171383 RepID=UPI001C08ABD6|nr:hypothetical protein [Vibrio hepatarius]MBU2897760.1 hypothetical protein [Vibrio hepatarius]